MPRAFRWRQGSCTKMEASMVMTCDWRASCDSRAGLSFERAAQRKMRGDPGSRGWGWGWAWALPYAFVDFGLCAAFAVDIPSLRSRSSALVSHVRRNADGGHAQSGGPGYPRHEGHSPRGALGDLLRADRTGACGGHRPNHPFAATRATGVSVQVGESNYRRYSGAALRQERAGHH